MDCGLFERRGSIDRPIPDPVACCIPQSNQIADRITGLQGSSRILNKILTQSGPEFTSRSHPGHRQMPGRGVNFAVMLSRSPIRSAIGVVLLLAALTTGLFVTPGVRHRHDAGDTAHSHSHAHPHKHSHSHHHSHGHAHGHPHADASVDHDHGEDDAASVDSSSDQLQPNGSTHVHITVFGFELTLPDFFDDRATTLPMVGSEQGTKNLPRDSYRSTNAAEDEILRLQSPFTLGHWIRVLLTWTAIVCSRFEADDACILSGRLCVPADLNISRPPPAPPLPPPKAH